MKNKITKAYSVLEISIVMIIIAVIIVGSLNGIEALRKSKLVTAQNLTEQSSVAQTKDLYLWLETSLAKSFLDNENDNGLKISKWRDINPQNLIANDATQSVNLNQPTLIFDRFNGAIPAVFFDGNDFLNFIGKDLANSSYTIFIVEKRMSAENFLAFIGGQNASANSNLVLGYRNSTTITQSHYNNDLDFSISAFDSPIARIHTFLFNTTIGKQYYLNGGDSPDSSNTMQTSPLNSFDNSWIGRYLGNYYFGDFGEIIIFKRSLRNEERKSIENYLSKKYNINIQ